MKKNINIRTKFRKFRRKARRKIFENLGSALYSRPACHDMDWKLEKYLNKENGFFIEVGANSGYYQSNTYYLEKFKKWKGILVEPIPELYSECVKERPNSKVFNCALVSSNFPDSHIKMTYAGLMTIVDGALDEKETEKKHLQAAIECQDNLVTYSVEVPTKTLNSLLEECQVEQIDFFSLDVEGYEIEVLKGLDLNKYKPTYLLIEVNMLIKNKKYDLLLAYLENNYQYIDQLSSRDYLFKSK